MVENELHMKALCYWSLVGCSKGLKKKGRGTMGYKRAIMRKAKAAKLATGRIYTIEVVHEEGCSKWHGGRCDCKPCIEQVKPAPADAGKE